MYGRVITTRSPTQRSQVKQPAVRPVNEYESNSSGRVLGDVSQEEARHLQTLKYDEDRKRFLEKEKKKAEKKREEKWKRYCHVDVGERLNSSDVDMEAVRDEQQFNYDLQTPDGLELERQRKLARLEREKRKGEEKLESCSNISSSQALASQPGPSRCVDAIVRARQQLQLSYETQSAEGLKLEREKEIARLKREEKIREMKMKRYDHVSVGYRLNSDAPMPSPGCSRQSSYNGPDVVGLEGQVSDINLNANYDSAMGEKTKHYQEKKFKTENFSSKTVCSAGSSSLHLNNLNATTESEAANNVVLSEAERNEQNRERMRVARERMQKKYDEELQKLS